MNRILIIFSILVVSILAYADARDRLKELDAVAANTPAQVEMKSIFHDNAPDKKFEESNATQTQTQTNSNRQLDKNIEQNRQILKDFQKNRNDDIFK